MRTRVTKKVEFDMGHRLPNYNGKCKHLHGHRYVLLVTVEGKIENNEGRSDEGMIIDFAALKEAINIVVDEIDHKMMLYHHDPLCQVYVKASIRSEQDDGIYLVNFVPTAENIANWIFDRLRRLLFNMHLVRVQLYETPTSMAEVTNED